MGWFRNYTKYIAVFYHPRHGNAYTIIYEGDDNEVRILQTNTNAFKWMSEF